MSENTFSTMDAYCAGFLVLQGHRPQLLSEGPKVVFVFPSTPALSEHITNYHSGGKVEAIKLANAIKFLKSQMFLRKRMEMENGGSSHGRIPSL
ncbi:MAG: hypothetical protein QY316_06385 [Thermodesulfobacteriota bacterium]|nr:MAG: hypothetical protein QY316_06385 [Thermodesulfobacteriota bacterium]